MNGVCELAIFPGFPSKLDELSWATMIHNHTKKWYDSTSRGGQEEDSGRATKSP